MAWFAETYRSSGTVYEKPEEERGAKQSEDDSSGDDAGEYGRFGMTCPNDMDHSPVRAFGGKAFSGGDAAIAIRPAVEVRASAIVMLAFPVTRRHGDYFRGAGT